MRRCEAMWPLVLVPKLLSGSLNNNIIQDLLNSQQGIQLNVSCACRKVREYGVCVNHASGHKKRAGTSKDKLCRSYCDHKER